MAYSLYLYAPVNEGISNLQVLEFEYIGGPLVSINNYPPLGVGVSAFSVTNTTHAFGITPILSDGSAAVTYRWIVNVDGVVNQYENQQTFTYSPTGGESVVQIRVEMPGTASVFYGTLTLDANGGSLGGIQSTYSLQGPAEAVGGFNQASFTFPTEKPTREDYTFAGWGGSTTNPLTVFGAGETAKLNVSAFPPGPAYTYYAQWAKGGDGVVRIGNGTGFDLATPYIWNDGWKPAAPYVWNGSWKKGT